MTKLISLVFLAIVFSAPAIAVASDDQSPSFDQLITLLELDPSVKEKALSGEIVMVDREDSTSKELAIGLLAVVRKPYAQVIDAVKGDRLFQFHQHVLKFARIKGVPDASKFQALGYTAADVEEVRALIAVEPGEQFNLSAAEIARFQQLQAEVEGLDDVALIDIVNDALREFLAHRLRRYQEVGLEGIAQYQRSGRETSAPAEELHSATRAMDDLNLFAPNFHSILRRFPNAGVQEVRHRFYVFKLDIAGRPGFVLAHRIYYFGDELTLAVERHIYAPHFYNSLQIVAGLMPYEDNTVMFYSGRTYTDQVTGFGSGIKHSVGGKQLSLSVETLISDIRRGIESGHAD